MLIICLLAPILAFAETEEPVPTEPLRLTLRDCIVTALENNLDISIERLNPLLDEATILQNRGEFDPALVLTPNYQEDSTPLNAQSSVAAGGRLSTRSRTSSIATDIEGKIPTGTTYNLGLQTTDSQSTFNSFQDQYTSFWGLSLTQPLLKGFGAGSQLMTIRLARKTKAMSEEAFALKVMDIVTQIRTAYYGLAYEIENRVVQLQALELAVKLLEENRKKVEIGVMAPLEVIQAESGVARGEESVIIADQQVNKAMNSLRALISQNISEIRERPLIPIDPPNEALVFERQRDEVVTHAMELRPDYRSARLDVDRSNIQLKYDQNQRYPQVDLVGSYGFNGIGNNLPDSLTAEDRKWSIGFSVRIPLPDQAGQGTLDASKLKKERTILQLKQIEQKILVEVDNAMEKVQTGYKRIRATKISTHAAQEVLNAEMTKLKAGTTTSYQVLEIQQKLTEARKREIEALKDYNVSLAELQKVEGVSLRENDIELEK